MNIRFNIDGSIDGLATNETQLFLSDLGQIEDFGFSKVKFLYTTNDQTVYEILDEVGHECSLCNKIASHFWLIENKHEHVIFCFDGC